MKDVVFLLSRAWGKDVTIQSELQLLPLRTITKKTLGDRSFMASAPKLWNRLPSNVRAVNDLNCFKRLLKTHLFRQAFSCLL